MILFRLIFLAVLIPTLWAGFYVMGALMALAGAMSFISDCIGDVFDWYMRWMYRTINRQMEKL